MNEYCLNFFSEFEKEYQNIKTTNSDSIVISHKVTELIETRSKELFKWLKKHKFSSPEEEIYFFKDLKPIFISKLIFYKTVLSIETNLPTSKKNKIKFYEDALNLIQENTNKNRKFYEYYRARASHKDNIYFLRESDANIIKRDCSLINYDVKLCTTHDYNMAVMIANDTLTNYLENKIEQLENNCTIVHPSIQQTVNWTGTKIDLIELIYALHHSKKINNGNTDIKELALFFGKIFNQDIEENIYRFYIDIKNRKTGRSKFINQLSEVLEKQILEEENESK
ncbi:RteC domain-containing protein [Flavobacterium sp.]|uniref:RteC domain-containing protein n=1 Tax=Flavobacterium sp. TaxID=239 RepID=UPI004048C673